MHSGSRPFFAKASVNAMSRRTFYPKSDRAITCKQDSWSSEWPTMYQQSSSLKDVGNRNLAIVNRAPTMPSKSADCNDGIPEEGGIEKVIREVSKVVATIGTCITLYRYWKREQLAKRKLFDNKKAIIRKIWELKMIEMVADVFRYAEKFYKSYID